jgi:SAM-dependent methyltransferase
MEKIHPSNEQWFHTPPGSMLLALEKQQLQRMLAHQFGDVLVQLGGPMDGLFTNPSPIVHRITIGQESCPIKGIPYVKSHFDELPLRPDSVDIIVCMHVLEFADEPELILEQIYQALVPQGQVLIIGFNPTSLWGLSRFFHASKDFPWSGKFHSQTRIQSMLQKVGYHVSAKKTLCFRPPLRSRKLWSSLLVLEPLGQFFAPDLGGVYFLSARKKVWGMNPIIERFRQSPVITDRGCPAPSTREQL